MTPENLTLPIPHRDFVDLLDLCVTFNYFAFDQKLYKQKFGMAMGSPISAVLANLFMESMEVGPYANIIPPNVTWLRYVDDVLLIAPRRLSIKQLQDKINEVEESIQFTLESEEDGKLPFLDTLLVKDGNLLKFKVYRKPTNKNDLLHYFSHHALQVKRGVVIGFFLRALRVCSPEFLEEECQYIYDTFRRLRYPPHIIRRCRERATNIMQSPTVERPRPRWVVLPTGNTASVLSRVMTSDKMKIVCGTSKTIRDITRPKKVSSGEAIAGVYVIPCGQCDKKYVGETARGLNIRVREHKYACHIWDTNNACYGHRYSHGHSMAWGNAHMLAEVTDKIRRKCLEAGVIQNYPTIEQNSGMFSLAPPLSELVLKAYRINTVTTPTRPP